MTSLRPFVTAASAVVGAALGAAIVTVPLTTSTSSVEVGVSAAKEPLPQVEPVSIPLPVTPAPVAQEAPVVPVSVAVPAVAPEAVEVEPRRWAFTPNAVQRSTVLETGTRKAPAMSSPTGSGGTAAVAERRPMAPEGIARDLADSATKLAEQTRAALGALMPAAPAGD